MVFSRSLPPLNRDFYRRLQTLVNQWEAIAFKAPLDLRKTEQVIGELYQFLGYPKPVIEFAASPQAAISLLDQKQRMKFDLNVHSSYFINWKKNLNKQLAASKLDALPKEEQQEIALLVLSSIGDPPWQCLPSTSQDRATGNSLVEMIQDNVYDFFTDQILEQITDHHRQIISEIDWSQGRRFLISPWDLANQISLISPLEATLKRLVNETLSDALWQFLWQFSFNPQRLERRQFLYPEQWIWNSPLISAFDQAFYRDILHFTVDEKRWQLWEKFLTHCGWLLPFENYCIVCQRANYLFDDQGFLHADGQPAIAFGDGTGFYFFHGVALPEKYQIPSTHWQTDWLLTENNAQVRSALIQGLGYARICQELAVETLDYWQGYELLKVQASISDEPVLLLKMTCPSTQKIHVLRIPPHLRGARQAITWINWGIDPEALTYQV